MTMDGDDYFFDLLLFHKKTSPFGSLELKLEKFRQGVQRSNEILLEMAEPYMSVYPMKTSLPG
jgi:hypothetical protein